MRVVIQRVKEGNVTIASKVVGEIAKGFVILLGIETDDGTDDLDWLVRKIVQLRVFPDKEGKMNQSILETNGEILVISQFTLHASTKKGNRPSFIKAARPEQAIPLYESFIKELDKILPTSIQSGEFGADMQVQLTNDGPVTIWIDSKNKE